ncbi:uncharacterized protein MONBRDRAFT_38353, partial [Monosiga brevicollis MX1]
GWIGPKGVSQSLAPLSLSLARSFCPSLAGPLGAREAGALQTGLRLRAGCQKLWTGPHHC